MAPVIRGNSLYTIVDGPSWTQAEANSVALGGHLVAITDSSEYDFVGNEFSNYKYKSEGTLPSDFPNSLKLWIGLYDAGSAQGARGGDRNWQWSSGEKYNYIAPGSETISSDTGEKYVQSNFNIPSWVGAGITPYGFWQDYPNTDVDVNQGIAEIPFVQRGNSAYVIVQGPTWEEAEANAVKLGGHLVTVNDKDENDFLYNSFIQPKIGTPFLPEPFVNGFRYWGAYWIGLSDKINEGTWQWISGENSNYSNWYGKVGGDDAHGGQDYGVFGWQWSNSWDDEGGPGEGRQEGLYGIAEIKLSTPTPTYTLTPSASSINEGSTLTISVATTDVASGTTLYYSLSGTGINSADLSSGSLTGSGTVSSSGSFSFSHTLANDLITEGTETLSIKLFSDSSRSTQVGSTASVSIADTSTTPPTYTLTPSTSSINEGSTLTTSVATTNVAVGTTLYYSLSGTGINTSDFSSGSITGSGTVSSSGSFSFSHTLANDLTTEGTESLNIKLYSDSSRINQVGNTSTISIVDTSIPPALFTVAGSLVIEGSTATALITRSGNTGIPVDIDLFTSNNNALAGSDYSALNTVVSFNSGETMKSVSISIIDDSTVEGDETFNVSISSSNANASITTKSSGITILDNDFNPIYSISPSSNSINEGSSLTTTINTSYVVNGTTLYWSLSGNGISASDFSAGSLSDAANTGSDGKIIFSHTLANDLATEGAEILNILLYKDSNRTQQVASTAIFISDTSFTPASTININGGNNGVANTGTINNNGTINTGTSNTNSGNTTTTSNVSTVNNITNNYVYYNSNNTTTNTNSGNTLSTWNTFWVDNSVKAGDIVNQWFGVETPVALQVQDPTELKLLDITTSSWTEKVKINRVAKASDKGDTIEGKQKDSSSTDIVGSVLTGGKGNDSIQAKAGWDMVDGGDGDDLVKTGNGRDILTGGTGRDELWGGFGWNTYKGDKDGFSDLIVIKSDQHLANPTLGNKSGNNSDGLKTDIIENLDSIDRIIIQGVETNQITFASNATAHGLTGIGIYSKGFIEALYTGADLSVAQLTAMTTGDTSAAVMNNTLTSYGVW